MATLETEARGMPSTDERSPDAIPPRYHRSPRAGQPGARIGTSEIARRCWDVAVVELQIRQDVPGRSS